MLNAPWGTAPAHANFGLYAGDLLIGNFGGGRINAFHENADGTWTNSGFLKNAAGDPLVIPGLWALQFGFGNANSGARNHLYYTAGPMGETEGVLGRIEPNPLEVGGTVPATLALTLGPAVSLRRVRRRASPSDYTATRHGDRHSTAGDATLSVSDPGPADQRDVLAPAAAPGRVLEVDVGRPGVQRPGDDHVHPADRRQRRAAHRHLLEDPHVHPLHHEPVEGGDAAADDGPASPRTVRGGGGYCPTDPTHRKCEDDEYLTLGFMSDAVPIGTIPAWP